MAYNGTGTWNRLYNWTNDANNGVKIRSDRMDAEFNDMCNNGLSAVVTRDGQGVPSALIPFASGISVGGGDNITTLKSGTFTPTDQSGASLSFTVDRAVYTQIGTRVWVELTLVYPVTSDSSAIAIGLGALPNCANVTGTSGMWSVYFGGAVFLAGYMTPNTNKFSLYDTTGSQQHNVGLSGATIRCQFNYATV